MSRIEYQPIGVIHSPFKEPAGMPIQPLGAQGVEGRVEVAAAYEEGLQDLSDFSHIILLYHFHRSRGYRLRVTPFLDDEPRGLFATRAPRRPNPIGLSVVRLLRIEGTTLYIANVDVLDGTPLLDIKPYVPDFNAIPNDEKVRTGWLEYRSDRADNHRSDHRFAAPEESADEAD